jgi:hypothetical protein
MHSIDVKWWHVVGGLFILFVGLPYVLGSAWYYLKAGEDSTDARFSEAEKAQLLLLQPQLDWLVFSKEEIQSVPGGAFYDCTTPNNNAGVYYDTKDEESDAVDVTEARPNEVSKRPRGDSEFCNDADGSWLAFHASTEPTKSEVVHDLRVLAELAEHKDEDLRSVVLPLAEYHAGQGEVLEYGWLHIDGVGDAGFGIEATISLNSGVYKVYRVTFIRGVIWAGLTVRLPESTADANEPIRLAQQFDRKIKSRLEAVLADPGAN